MVGYQDAFGFGDFEILDEVFKIREVSQVVAPWVPRIDIAVLLKDQGSQSSA